MDVTADKEDADSDMDIVKPHKRVNIILSDSSSSDESDSNISSDDDAEKCPICLLTFRTQEVGSPESCDHQFCLECIKEWSKNINTCPVDRQSFNLILVRNVYNGKIINQVPVEQPNTQPVENVETDIVYCEICSQWDREDTLLLCDGCDCGYHLDCLTPPLYAVPLDDWFCPECDPEIDRSRDYLITINEIENLLDDARDIQPTGPRPRPNRLVPRTRQSQRIIDRIMSNRNQVSSNDEDQTNDAPNIPSSTTNQPKTRRNGTKRRKKRKTKSRRRCRKRRVKTPKTVKSRLAMKLGMRAPRQSFQNLPDVKVNDNRPETSNLVGSQQLHIFGPKEDLDFCSDDSSNNEFIKSRAPTCYDALIFQHSVSDNKKAKIARSLDMPSTSTSSCDIIGNILESQEKLYSKQFKQSLKNDGTIAYGQASSQNVSASSSSAQDLSDMYKHSNNYVKNANLVDDLCVNSTTNENLSVKTDLHTTDDNLSSEEKNNDAESVYSPLEEPNKSPIPIIKEACTSNSNKSAKSKVKDRLDALFGPDSPTDAHNAVNEDSSNTNNKVLKKLKMQEYVATIVKSCLKPYYVKMRITKDEYKDILRRAVPKISHSVVGKVYKEKVRQLIEAYVRKIRSQRRLTS